MMQDFVTSDWMNIDLVDQGFVKSGQFRLI